MCACVCAYVHMYQRRTQKYWFVSLYHISSVVRSDFQVDVHSLNTRPWKVSVRRNWDQTRRRPWGHRHNTDDCMRGCRVVSCEQYWIQWACFKYSRLIWPRGLCLFYRIINPWPFVELRRHRVLVSLFRFPIDTLLCPSDPCRPAWSTYNLSVTGPKRNAQNDEWQGNEAKWNEKGRTWKQ